MAGGLDTGPRRGEIWLYRFDPPDKRRPVVVLTRSEVLPLLRTAMVAPITSTIRGLSSEVIVGVDEGLKNDSAINCDHIQSVDQRMLRRYVGSLSESKMVEVCRAVAIATGCA
ncbi:MAG: type II toxin-antitoxin system PemK/MazF family toxin [Chloroflexota bacterium]|nr:type II toxin-antitoxin system PemK/MazF family toxin [Chloroflexota bacterium]